MIKTGGNVKHLPLRRQCNFRVDRCWGRRGGVSGDDDDDYHALIIAV